MRLKKFRDFLLLALIVVPVYVLPYPGQMPGNKVYLLKQVTDRLGEFWAFGNFARHKYELGLADKKLVEAKTLFEYQQYPLALRALENSNTHFKKAMEFLVKAEKEGKDISQKAANLKAAAEKHREVLRKLTTELPPEFFWQPEKAPGQKLFIRQVLEEAIKFREI